MKLILIGEQFKLFDSVSLASTTNGTSFALPARATQLTYQTSFSSSPSSITANIQVSNDNLAWSTISSSSNTSGEAITFNSSALFVRAQVSAISGGAGKTITLIIIAKAVSIGSSTLAGLSDVDISGPTNGQVLIYDSGTNKWINSAGGGGNPFDQDLNTFDSPSFFNMNVSENLTFNNTYTLTHVGSVITLDTAFEADGINITENNQLAWENGPTIGMDGFSLILNGAWTINGDGLLSNSGGGSLDLGGFGIIHGNLLTYDSGDLTISTTTSGMVRLDGIDGTIATGFFSASGIGINGVPASDTISFYDNSTIGVDGIATGNFVINPTLALQIPPLAAASGLTAVLIADDDGKITSTRNPTLESITVLTLTDLSTINGPLATDMFFASQGAFLIENQNGAVLEMLSSGQVGLSSGMGESLSLFSSGEMIITSNGSPLTINSASGNMDISVAGNLSIDSQTAISTTITTGSLVGKTITVTKGLITGFA